MTLDELKTAGVNFFLADVAVTEATAENGALPNSVTWNISGSRGKASVSMSIFDALDPADWQTQAEPRWQRALDWMTA